MWDYGYIPKGHDYPTPFRVPNPVTTEYDETSEIQDTLDSIKQAEIQFGYSKETRDNKEENWDYYNNRPLTKIE